MWYGENQENEYEEEVWRIWMVRTGWTLVNKYGIRTNLNKLCSVKGEPEESAVYKGTRRMSMVQGKPEKSTVYKGTRRMSMVQGEPK